MNLIQNIILTNLFIILIYLVYKAGYSRNSFFKANRFFLLTGLATAMVLPWISPVLNFLSPVNEIQWLPAAPIVADETLIMAEGTLVEPEYVASPLQLALRVYMAMTAIICLTSILLWIKLLISTRKAPVHRYGQMKVIVIKRSWTAFSFFRTIFYPHPFDPTLPETRLILEHELVHSRQLHTLDNLFYGVVRLLFFFNPFIHLLHKELMITHEYLADRLTSGNDRPGYSRILISHQFKVPHFLLMHPFNKQSFLKRRLNMLSKSTQNHLAGWKYLLALPLLGGMILASSWTVTAQDQAKKSKEEIAKMAVEKELTKAGYSKAEIEEIKLRIDGIPYSKEVLGKPTPPKEPLKGKMEGTNQQVFLIVEDMPTFQGGTVENFRNWVQKNVKYPAEAKAKKISGTEYVSFVVDTMGKVSNITIVRSSSPILDEEVIRVMKSAPDWNPGKQRGQPVNVSFSIPVKFMLDKTPAKKVDGKSETKKANPVKPDEAEKQVFLITEEMPEFQGGTLDKFRNWAQANVKYPAKAMENSISGTVEVGFIVNRDGKVEDVHIVKSVDPVLDDAVINVVKSSPDWTPGKQRGKVVKVSQNMPIKFILQ